MQPANLNSNGIFQGIFRWLDRLTLHADWDKMLTLRWRGVDEEDDRDDDMARTGLIGSKWLEEEIDPILVQNRQEIDLC